MMTRRPFFWPAIEREQKRFRKALMHSLNEIGPDDTPHRPLSPIEQRIVNELRRRREMAAERVSEATGEVGMNEYPLICYCLETKCHCEPQDMLIMRDRWRCPRCEDEMAIKFRLSHTVICAWRERVLRIPPRLSRDAATWTPDQEDDA